MGIKINEYPIEGTDINDDSYIDVDQWNGTGYESNKVKWLTVLSTAIRGFAKLASNNIFTGTNQFNKQVKIKSDGTNSPLVVRNSTDTADLLNISSNGGDYVIDSASSVIITTFKQNGVTRGREYYSASGQKVYEWDSFAFRNRTNSVLYIQSSNGERLITNDPSSTQQPRPGSIQTIIGSILQEQAYSGTNQDASSILDIRATSKGILIPRLTTTQRNAMGGTLPTSLLIFNSTTNQYEFWNGSAWTALGGVSWGSITGTLSSQTDLQTALDTKVENGANVGAVGSGIFKDKTGTTLNFRKLVNAGGIGVAINGDNVELTNQHVNIVDMNDTFFGTLVANDLIQYDGTSWINIQPSTLPISTAAQAAFDLKQDKPLTATVTTTTNTTTAIYTIPIPTNTSKNVRYSIKGRNNTTGTTIGSECFFVANNIGGVVTQVGTLSQDRKSGFTNSVQSSIAVSGTNMVISVTGATGQTIDWQIFIREII